VTERECKNTQVVIDCIWVFTRACTHVWYMFVFYVWVWLPSSRSKMPTAIVREIQTLSWCIRDEMDSPKPTIDREHVTAYIISKHDHGSQLTVSVIYLTEASTQSYMTFKNKYDCMTISSWQKCLLRDDCNKTFCLTVYGFYYFTQIVW